MSICEPDGRKHRNRKWTMSRSEIMTILGAPDKPCGVGRADANPKTMFPNDT